MAVRASGPSHVHNSGIPTPPKSALPPPPLLRGALLPATGLAAPGQAHQRALGYLVVRFSWVGGTVGLFVGNTIGLVEIPKFWRYRANLAAVPVYPVDDVGASPPAAEVCFDTIPRLGGGWRGGGISLRSGTDPESAKLGRIPTRVWVLEARLLVIRGVLSPVPSGSNLPKGLGERSGWVLVLPGCDWVLAGQSAPSSWFWPNCKKFWTAPAMRPSEGVPSPSSYWSTGR